MAIMKSRHAAALALTFWLLMIPPVQQGGRGDFNAPIKSWRPVQLFGSLPECDQTRQATIAFGANKQDKQVFEKMFKAASGSQFFDAARTLASHAKCVSSDDPGLNSNPATPIPKTNH